MSTIQLDQSKIRSGLLLLGLIIYSFLLFVMTVNYESVNSARYLGSMILALLLSCILPISSFCNCVFLTLPFTAVLKLPVDYFSYITLLQLILIFRAFLYKKEINYKTVFFILIFTFLSQFIPLVSYEQNANNLILLSFNFLTFYCIYRLTIFNSIKINSCFISFSIGVLLASWIAFTYDITTIRGENFLTRFCGLWTDPNFWGLFCILGMVTCLIKSINSPKLAIILIPILIGIGYYGFMTLSRTFVVVMGLMIIVILMSYVKSSIQSKILVLLILVISVIYTLPLAHEIFIERELIDDDITNGRIDHTIEVIEFIKDNIFALFFGVGYNNEMTILNIYDIGETATHNSYVDFIVEFGLIFDVCILLIIFKFLKIKKYNIIKFNSEPMLILFVLLFYMGSLSILKYAFLYLFMGCIFGYLSKEQNESQITRSDDNQSILNLQ